MPAPSTQASSERPAEHASAAGQASSERPAEHASFRGASQGQRALLIALVASLAIHLGAGGVLRAIDDGVSPFGGGDEDFLDAIELEVAPVPPEAFDPGDESDESDEPEPELDEPEPQDQRVAVVEPLPEPELDPGPAEIPDAGVPPEPDAGALASEASDAAVSESDAGPEAIATADRDAGATADRDAGPATTASLTDIEPSKTVSEGASDRGKKIPTGAAADFRAYTPKGEVLGVLIRFDRLRGTPWAKRVDAVLRSMPDYRMIIGDRDLPLADLFDMLLVSSRDPSNVTATNLAGYTPSRTPAAMREFLDHKAAPVHWLAARGGALGRRGKSKLSQPGDPRVYLMPFSGWTVLTGPKHLGALARPTSSDVNAFPEDKDLPRWLSNIRNVGDESGDEAEGPVVVASFHGGPAALAIPIIGDLPTPDRLSVALNITSLGFRVQGTMMFSTEERAAEFEAMVNDGKSRMVDTVVGKRLLRQFHALNAAKGLTLTRRGQKMSYVTSFSIADAKAMLVRAAELSERFYLSSRGSSRGGAD